MNIITILYEYYSYNIYSVLYILLEDNLHKYNVVIIT